MTTSALRPEELAARIDVAPSTAQALLEGLERAGLVEQPAPGFYRLTAAAERRYGLALRSIGAPRRLEGGSS